MSHDPPRLTSVGATELEKRLLEAAAGERPSPELTRRMGLALGFSAPTAVAKVSATSAATANTATNAATNAATMNAAATNVAATNVTANLATTKIVLAWVTAGVLAAAVTVGVIGVKTSSRWLSRSSPTTEVGSPPATGELPRRVPPEPDRVVPRSLTDAAGARHHAGTVTNAAASDLRGEIALIDAARIALEARASERALALLHRYDATYSLGTLRPEAAALRIEALAQNGQTERARALAGDFVAKHPDSPLSYRLSHIARGGRSD